LNAAASATNAAATTSAPRSAWRERGLALAAVALPLFVLFGPAMFSDRLFALRDAGHYYYPLFKWCADEWGTGRLPLWDPLENCGTAIHADPTASLWYPGKLVFALPLDFSVKYKLYIVGHAALAALAAYWLARRWGGSRYGAALAALAYAGGGSVVFQYANVVYLVGAAWLPVAAGLVDDIFRNATEGVPYNAELRQGRGAAAVWLGVVVALVVLGGDPQMAYHVLLLAALRAVVLLIRRHPDSEPRGQARRAAAWGIGLAAASAVIALCLAAIQILPTAAATSASARAAYDRPRNVYEAGELLLAGRPAAETRESLPEIREGLLGQPPAGSHLASAYDYSVAPWRLAELVWPNIGGRMFPTHRRWFSLLPGESRIWTPTLYLGFLPLVLACSMFGLRSEDVRIRWLSWVALLFGLGSFGSYGLGWLLRHALALTGAESPIGDGVGGVYWLFVVFLPKYVLFRYPAKLLVVAALAISQLAAIGWDRALVQPPQRLIGWLRLLGLISGVAALAALIAAQFLVLGADQADPVFGPFDNRGCWNDIVAALAQTSIVALGATWLLSLPRGKNQAPEANRSESHSFRAAMLFLCAADVTLANHWLVPTAPSHYWRQSSPIAVEMRSAGESARLYRVRVAWPSEFSTAGSPQRLEELVRWERATLAGRYGLLDRVAVVNSQVGISADNHDRMLKLLEQSTKGDPARDSFGKLGVTHILAPESVEWSFAKSAAANGLPDGVTLLRVDRDPHDHGGPVEYANNLATFRLGAAISVIGWGALLIAAAVARWRFRTASIQVRSARRRAATERTQIE
jgi:hypothetical protein